MWLVSACRTCQWVGTKFIFAFLCYVIGGSSSLHSGHVDKCSDLLLDMPLSIQRLRVPVQCWLMTPLMHREYRLVLVMLFFTLNLYPPFLQALLRPLAISAQPIRWPSSMVASPASPSAFSLPLTPWFKNEGDTMDTLLYMCSLRSSIHLKLYASLVFFGHVRLKMSAGWKILCLITCV